MLVKQTLTNIVPDIVTAPVERAVSGLGSGHMLTSLLLNCLHLGLVSTAEEAAHMLSLSLLSLQTSAAPAELLSSSLQYLLDNSLIRSNTETDITQQTVNNQTVLVATTLGRACVNGKTISFYCFLIIIIPMPGNIDLKWAQTLYKDLELARPCLAVDTCLHLLYLITPYDMSNSDRCLYTASNYHRY